MSTQRATHKDVQFLSLPYTLSYTRVPFASLGYKAHLLLFSNNKSALLLRPTLNTRRVLAQRLRMWKAVLYVQLPECLYQLCVGWGMTVQARHRWRLGGVCIYVHSVQSSSVAQSCPTLCDPMNLSTPGLPVHHQLPEFTQTHAHWVSDAIQPSHPLSSLSPPGPNPSQHTLGGH